MKIINYLNICIRSSLYSQLFSYICPLQSFEVIDRLSVYRESMVSIFSFLFHSTRLRVGRHSGVWVAEYFGAQGRSSDGALHLVRKRILSDTTSTAAVTPWQPTYAEKSILNEVTWLQTRSLFFAHNRCYFRSPPRATSDFVTFPAYRNSNIGVWLKKIVSTMLKINASPPLQLLNSLVTRLAGYSFNKIKSLLII